MRLTISLFLCFVQFCGFAQVVQVPPISKNDLIQTTYSLDSTAHAIVLWEKGHTELQRSDADRALMVFHQYGVRIKIIDQEGYAHANHTIPLRIFNGNKEYATDIKAVSHHLAADGNIVSTELKRGDIFHEKASEYVTLTKFTLPDVRPGSVIDISYTVVSPDIFKFRSWDFQTDIPKLSSEYNIYIPASFKYNVSLRGALQLSDTQASALRECFIFNGQRIDCSNITYSMHNIPAFVEEDYMLAAANYRSGVHFELEEALSPQGNMMKFTKKWSDVDRELMTDKSFGRQLKETKFFHSKLPSETKDLKDDLQKATAVYRFIQQRIRWNNYYGKYTQNGVREAFEKRSGNIADINLALITAFQAAGLEAYPLLVSTRDNIVPTDLYPVISEFNYVVAAVQIGADTILADASEALLPFGELPLRAINDRGRIIFSSRSSDWIPLRNNSLTSTTYDFVGEFDLSGKLIGELSVSTSGYDAFQRRKTIRSYPSHAEYQEKLDERLTHIDISDMQILQDSTIDLPLIERLNIQTTVSSAVQAGEFAFNPIFIDRVTKNPFNLADRTYPVDMGAQKKEVHQMSIRFPAGVSLQSAPKNVHLSIPNQAARYVYRSTFADNTLTIVQELSMNKAIYHPDEYFHLKELFSRVIQQLKIDHIFLYKE